MEVDSLGSSGQGRKTRPCAMEQMLGTRESGQLFVDGKQCISG